LIHINLGLPVEHLIEDLVLTRKKQVELIVNFREILSLEILQDNRLFEGVVSFILACKSRGLSIAVATSKPTYLAKLVVLNSKLGPLVDFTQGTDNFLPKPAPDVIIKCLEFLESQTGLMFGDRKEDMIAGTAASLTSIGIVNSSHSHLDLKESGALRTYDNYFEMIKDIDWLIQICQNN
jgi:phosphoglycolate phosphatase